MITWKQILNHFPKGNSQLLTAAVLLWCWLHFMNKFKCVINKCSLMSLALYFTLSFPFWGICTPCVYIYRTLKAVWFWYKSHKNSHRIFRLQADERENKWLTLSALAALCMYEQFDTADMLIFCNRERRKNNELHFQQFFLIYDCNKSQMHHCFVFSTHETVEHFGSHFASKLQNEDHVSVCSRNAHNSDKFYYQPIIHNWIMDKQLIYSWLFD